MCSIEVFMTLLAACIVNQNKAIDELSSQNFLSDLLGTKLVRSDSSQKESQLLIDMLWTLSSHMLT